ncbi:MAG: restriction endonuclease subunit S [Gemmatimonadota bacterium]|nr:restriction endonuclease subunit S [Gemmatimonadota bacterium]
MVDRLRLPQRYRRILVELLREHVPEAEVWAFGSRITGESHEGSDLDLVVRGPELKPLYDGFFELLEAIEQSNIPILVQAHDWARLPASFQQEIERDYMVVQDKGTKETMDGEWRELPFSEAVTMNPTVQLDRGTVYPYVEMAAVNADSRMANSLEKREFKGSGSKFQTGDTLMARITPCLENGKIARYQSQNDGQSAHGSTEFIVIRGRPGVTDNDFAYYLTRSEEVRNYAIGQMTGTSGRQRVPADSLEHLFLSIPPLVEQRQIAHILGTLDDKIELNHRMNETLEEMARALFKSWFVDFDPVRAKAALASPPSEKSDWTKKRALAYLDKMDKNIVDIFPDRLVESELGEIPEAWEVGVLNDALELLSGGTPRTSEGSYWDGDIPWYTAKDAPSLSDVFVLETERNITQLGIYNSAAKVLPIGTTIITARGTVGTLACLGVPMAMNQTCYGIRGANGYPDLFTYLNVRTVVDELQQRTHGTVFDTITRQTFKFIEKAMPPAKLANAFESTAKPVMRRILNNLHESQTLAAKRDALLPRLMTGKSTV